VVWPGWVAGLAFIHFAGANLKNSVYLCILNRIAAASFLFLAKALTNLIRAIANNLSKLKTKKYSGKTD